MNSIESQFDGVKTTFNLTRTISGVTSDFYPISSEQLLVSLGDVIQKPDTSGNTGFKINFNQIVFAIPPNTGVSCFIIAYGNVTDVGAPANNTVTTDKLVDGSVTSAKIADGTIVDADVNASAAIAGTKISPDFGSQNVVTTGNVTINAQGDIRLGDADSSNWVAFQAPATVAADVTWTLPAADGTTGQVLSTNGSGALSWGTATAANYQEFTSSGTWTKPAGVTTVYVECVGGGGGGGSGRRDATTASRRGGGGGAGGAFVHQWFEAADLASTVSITVGAGGAGGAAVTTNTTSGEIGAAGGDSSFGSHVFTGTATGGLNGTTSIVPNSQAAAVSFKALNNVNAGNGGSTGGGSSTVWGGAGGGGGVGAAANSTGAVSGGTAGISRLLASSTPGATAGNNGTANEGGGGGGGSYTTATAGMAGGNGAFPGGGGGGGSASDNGHDSGAGGDGGAGVVRVWSW